MIKKKVESEEESVEECVVVDRVKKGPVHVTKFKTDKGLSYSLNITYRQGENWKSKKIGILHHELPNVVEALKEIYVL